MENDLTTASRGTLLALVEEQQKTIAQLEATVAQSQATISELQKRVAILEQRLTARGGPGMPGNKPTAPKTPPRKEKPKKRPHGFARIRMTPTEQVDHAVDTCPDCGTHLCGGWVPEATVKSWRFLFCPSASSSTASSRGSVPSVGSAVCPRGCWMASSSVSSVWGSI